MTHFPTSPNSPDRSAPASLTPALTTPFATVPLGLGAAVLAAAALGAFADAFGGGHLGSTNGALRAAGVVGSDTDGDGLSDDQEYVLGTRIDLADTDADGVSDLWEVARQSDPLVAGSVPSPASPRAAMAGYVSKQVLNVTTALLIPGGNVAALDLEIGLAIGGQKTPIASQIFASASSFRLLAGAGADTVLVMETRVPEAWVHTLGGVAFYVINRTGGLPASGDVLQLLSFYGEDANGDPLPALVRPEPAPLGLGAGPGAGGTNRTQRSGTGGGSNFAAGTVYRLLVADERVPSDWTPGQICYQEMSAVGANGVNVVMQVDSAACEPFDTFCSASNCQATVGQTIEFVDVGAIIGG